ncbi:MULTISPECIES: hypothetical protein [Anoxybacillaceae]|jgi:hypothetical protein|uniref:Uncharacterized protein n=2 Tax=Anoxybacillaceae TaxID=3120669 RepID=A0A023DEY9_9BACL|nr:MULTISPECIES: hypothetical protein [Bacillaceae]ABO67406.1 hypothetical protein GTNG_2054 [Geobacillus thermodenitrificans NG80-2]MBB3853158.1 hypothetical protein [Parageobacillus caldoxylosilyticus]MED0661414.1 hypothetical protein [Geobacillus thermodenitrificans]BDG34252.1 hypothetical protein PcaKH15_01580 [Parageobacillus caldoxylosilyticus]BDG38020.1 hypothetical protein PcaKH16_01590 [Parageobacillus caldoxylosilyticus]
MEVDKQKVAEVMVALQEAILSEDLARFYEHVGKLEKLTGEEFTGKVLCTFASQLSREHAIVNVILLPVIEELKRGEK